ncbi:hypothetical protein [Desulfurococcus mucosus]|uniref:Uncharacterized protein n=1 Tax=Desulfurococcus mucosus (strain ATCC 35584 / DSM 2162 / JCM 9187 / O7/1) TaxID=765177 RepID=E8R797_DESM0|nr:hypothetical protein [Desulfurococcus mucosus]ADV65562.1 hypothetical protein Desmu_1266 [Desulfurococcus mucosus DSM 2162]
MSREVRRRFVPLSDEVIQEALSVSERYGMPYSVLIEKALGGLLRVMRYKSSILESLVLVDAVDDLRRLGLIFLPSHVARRVIDEVDEELFTQLLDEVSRSARWFGELSRVKRGSSPREFQVSLSLWIPATTVDMVAEGDGVYKFIVSMADASPRMIRLLEKVVTGIAAGYDVKILDLASNVNTVVVRVTGFLEKE